MGPPMGSTESPGEESDSRPKVVSKERPEVTLGVFVEATVFWDGIGELIGVSYGIFAWGVFC